MIRYQMSSDAPPPINTVDINSQQLSRSKSLNDISNDSQISAFASDRFINLHNIGGNIPTDGKNPIVTCMPIDPYNYNQNSNNITVNHNDISNNNNNIYGTSSFENSRNLINNNQCSRPTNANVFNLCSPMSINLNGVTEQIENLRL